MTAVADALAGVLLVVGAMFSLFAAIGLLRFPDTLSRQHAASKPQVLGLVLILIGTGLRLRTSADVTVLALVAVFQLMTVPVGAQVVGRAVYRSGRVRRDLLIADDLAARREAGPDR